MQLEQYQIDMKNFIVNSLESTNKIVVIGMATGTGKTITAYAAITELLEDPSNRVLVLAHNQLVLRSNFVKQAHNIEPFEFKSKKDLTSVLSQRPVVFQTLLQ